MEENENGTNKCNVCGRVEDALLNTGECIFCMLQQEVNTAPEAALRFGLERYREGQFDHHIEGGALFGTAQLRNYHDWVIAYLRRHTGENK